jgi:16S rRNA (cytosine967-C5)-methyltransferase
MATAARRLAWLILVDVERGGPTLADRLADPEVEALPARDRALLHELVLGTLRQRGTLDHALAAVLDRPLDRVEAPVRTVLRLGAYQVFHLRVPDRAAVFESVELARGCAPRATGFVNAVLRRLAREGPPPVPDPEGDPLGWLTTAGSLPRWLAERWIARLGPGTAVARARAFLRLAPPVFRLNPRVPDAWARVRAAGLQPCPLAVPGAWEGGAAAPPELAASGVLYQQGLGSQMVAHPAARPGVILDACAAPGGKATLLGDLAGEAGWVVAAEASPRRLRVLDALVRRWGSNNVRVVGADGRRPPFGAPFDAVLLDAPCTGLGTLARHPDIRWRTRPEDLERHAHGQRELLEALAPLVKPGGSLVYSTCSTEPQENEDVALPFLRAHPEYGPAPLPAWAAPFAEGPFALTRPERHGGDAFFAAVLARR